jgi:hypothetical protein
MLQSSMLAMVPAGLIATARKKSFSPALGLGFPSVPEEYNKL